MRDRTTGCLASTFIMYLSRMFVICTDEMNQTLAINCTWIWELVKPPFKVLTLIPAAALNPNIIYFSLIESELLVALNHLAHWNECILFCSFCLFFIRLCKFCTFLSQSMMIVAPTLIKHSKSLHSSHWFPCTNDSSPALVITRGLIVLGLL